jgi:hypothetical protein
MISCIRIVRFSAAPCTIFFQRALESVTANHAWEQELKDPLFNRYLSLQVRPISPIPGVNGK